MQLTITDKKMLEEADRLNRYMKGLYDEVKAIHERLDTFDQAIKDLGDQSE